MTFEEEFHGLKGLADIAGSSHFIMISKNPIEVPPGKDVMSFYSEDKIKEHCLDKQKVRDIIENFKVRLSYLESESELDTDYQIELLKKELGL